MIDNLRVCKVVVQTSMTYTHSVYNARHVCTSDSMLAFAQLMASVLLLRSTTGPMRPATNAVMSRCTAFISISTSIGLNALPCGRISSSGRSSV